MRAPSRPFGARKKTKSKTGRERNGVKPIGTSQLEVTLCEEKKTVIGFKRRALRATQLASLRSNSPPERWLLSARPRFRKKGEEASY